MAVCVFSGKGGVGKSTISLNFASTKLWQIITNDSRSMLRLSMDKKDLLLLKQDQNIPSLKKDAKIIYDLGGHFDERVIKAFEQSEYVIIPTYKQISCLQLTIDSARTVEKYNKNIIFVANKISKTEDYETIKQALSKYFDYPILQLKDSKAMDIIFDEKTSLKKLVSEGGLREYHYKKINDQFDEIFKAVKVA